MAIQLSLKVLNKIKKLAYQNISFENSRCYHLAAIFRGNDILVTATNSCKTHPQIKRFKYHDFSKLHAELAACIKLGKTDCSKYCIAVIRIDKNGIINESKPCIGCQSVISQLGFKKVFFTNVHGMWETQKFLPIKQINTCEH